MPRFASGAAAGALAGTVYAIVETAAVTVAPRLLPSAGQALDLHGSLTALLFPVCALGGAALGGLGQSLFRRPDAATDTALATLCFLFSGNALAVAMQRPALLPLGIAALAAVLGAWHARPGSLAPGPWATSLLLAGPPWIAKELLRSHQPTALRAGAVLAFAATVLGLAFVASRRGGARSSGQAWGTAAAAGAIVLAAGAWLNRLPAPPSPADENAAARAPVVLVVLDTVRGDHLSLHGYPRKTSPRLEELAQDAVLFPRATASGDMTLSTHASLFTGTYAREHGARHPDLAAGESGPPSPLDARFETLAEVLSREGYRTLAVVANHGYLGPAFRLDQGFQYWDSRPALAWTQAPFTLRHRLRELTEPVPRSPLAGHAAFRPADDINREALALLDAVSSAPEPVLLFVNYMDAHFPYVAPPPFDRAFPGRSESLTVDGLDRLRRDVLLRGAAVPEEVRAHLVSQYDGAIAYVDSRLGLLMDELKARGLYDRAVVVVTSDHGEAFGERGLIDHGVSVYQDQVGIPLLVKLPGGRDAGRVVHSPVGSVDVLPAVLEVLGIPAPAGVRGRSPLAGDARHPPVITEHYPTARIAEANPRLGSVERAILDGPWKLVRSSEGGDEIFDLAADPAEAHPAEGPVADAVARELGARLDRWLEDGPRR